MENHICEEKQVAELSGVGELTSWTLQDACNMAVGNLQFFWDTILSLASQTGGERGPTIPNM